MPNYTSNYKLKKPLQNEFYDVDDQNGNMDIIDTELKKRATLDENGKVPSSQLPEVKFPEMNFIPTSEKGTAGGVASLGSDGKVPSSQLPEIKLPEMNFIPTSEKGKAGGVSTLDESGKVPSSQLPDDIGGSGKRAVRFAIGSSQYGWTASDCDYLCDGTADDAEINAAIQALRTTGGEIVLLDGLYNISAPIAINKDNVTLTGNGANTKLIRAFNDDEYDAEQGIILITASYCAVKNLYIDCKKSVYSSNNAINVYDGDNCTISDNTIINSSCDGIYVDGDYHSITNNIIIDCDGNGLYLYKGNKQVATNNRITGSGLYGMYVYNVKDSAVSNNVSTGNADSGIKVYWSDRSTFTGNVLNNNNQCGLYFTRGEGSVISGNTLNGNKHYGIYIDSMATKCVVMSNVFVKNTTGDIQNRGESNVIHLPNHTHDSADITGLNDAIANFGYGKMVCNSYVGSRSGSIHVEPGSGVQTLYIDGTLDGTLEDGTAPDPSSCYWKTAPKTITFPFEPKLLLLIRSDNKEIKVFFQNTSLTANVRSADNPNYSVMTEYFKFAGNSLIVTGGLRNTNNVGSGDSVDGYDLSGYTYYYVAFA